MTYILVIDDDVDLLEVLGAELELKGFKVSTESDHHKVTERLRRESFDVVISDYNMPGKNGLQVYKDAQKDLESVPPWIFLTGNVDPAVYEKLFQAGAGDVLLKPTNAAALQASVQKVLKHKDDPVVEIISIVQAISGIKLSGEKRLLVTNRLQRRARQLNLNSFEEYAAHLREHREQEVKYLVSLLSTHTTSFFREVAHFDYLLDKILPQYAKLNKPMKIWSGAASTGPEIYSLVITVAEYYRTRGYTGPIKNKVQILGTDIDFASIETCNNGVYDAETVKAIKPELLARYFKQGKGDLSGFYRINDDIHDACSFKVLNLMSEKYDTEKYDLILLRNILIYFDDATIQRIMNNLYEHLHADGYLFLGHSESIAHLKTKFSAVGNSIYRFKDAIKTQPVDVAAKGSSVVQGSKLKVMIVDDSAPIRTMLRKIFVPEAGFEVVAEAEDPVQAREMLKKVTVDVMTLDIHMPHMTGIQYLESLPPGVNHPPVVMVTSVNYEEATSGLRCFELGAVDVIEKPKLSDFLNESERIRNVVRDAAKVKGLRRMGEVSQVGVTAKPIQRLAAKAFDADLIVLGASTGGVEALTEILRELPSQVPPILIVQHIPPIFSATFAHRLSGICAFPVAEATHGMTVERGRAYIAPGGKQMAIKVHSDGRLTLNVNDDPPVNRFKPSVDYMFNSVCEYAPGHRIIAALMTGMGADGAVGLKKLRDLKAHTIAQDERTSVVWGMPGAAVKLGAAVEVLPLQKIAAGILNHQFKKKAA